MDNLVQTYLALIENPRETFRRELIEEIDWSSRIICIKGFRGVGKTTFLIDLIRERFPDYRSCLYVNLNNFYFTRRKLYSFADEFYKKGGKVLVLDQLHKYPGWAEELAACHHSFPGLQVIFSASPVLRVTGAHDKLRGIVKVYHLEGLSFREFLNFRGGFRFRRYRLEEILSGHPSIAREITAQVRPLAYFSDYLKNGFYPYFADNEPTTGEVLLKHINLALEFDLTYLNQIEMKYLPKLRRLLQSICAQAPFCPNVSKMSQDVETSRTTVMNYLWYMKNARLINLLTPNEEGGQLRKPEMVYAHDTNILYAVAPPGVSNQRLRTTFFYNQAGCLHRVGSSDRADFRIDGRYDVTVGGKNTKPAGEGSYAAADMIEVGSGNVIPLWLFGFLY